MYIAMTPSSKQLATDDAHVTDGNEVILPQGKSSANTIIKAYALFDLVNQEPSGA